MPGTRPRAFSNIWHSLSQHLHGMGAATAHISQMGTLRLRDISLLTGVFIARSMSLGLEYYLPP